MSFSRMLLFRQLFLRDKRSLIRKCSHSIINLTDPVTLTYFKCVMLEHEYLYRKVQKTPDELKRLLDIVPMVSALDSLYGDQETLEYLFKKHDGVGDLNRMVDKKTEAYILQKIKRSEAMILSAVMEPRLTRGSVLLDVTAETGGEEGFLFARKLVEMYKIYAESRNWEVKIASLEKSNITYNIISADEYNAEKNYGIKKASMLIDGHGAPEILKLEHGVHEALIPTKDLDIRTSCVSVVVLSQHSNSKENILDNDLVIETHQVESGVRITHIPTNTIVECNEDESQDENKEIAMQKLRTLVSHKFNREKDHVDSSNRSMKIRTYDWVQDLVTEHREGSGSIPNLENFMESESALQTLHENIIKHERLQEYLKDMNTFIKNIEIEAADNK